MVSHSTVFQTHKLFSITLAIIISQTTMTIHYDPTITSVLWMVDPDNSTVIAGVTIPVILLLCGIFAVVLMRRKGRRNGNVASSCLGKDGNHRGADGLSLPDGVIETTYVPTDFYWGSLKFPRIGCHDHITLSFILGRMEVESCTIQRFARSVIYLRRINFGLPQFYWIYQLYAGDSSLKPAIQTDQTIWLWLLDWLQTAGETEGLCRALPSYGRRFRFPLFWRIRLSEARRKGSALHGGRFACQPAQKSLH